jgi:hypothetical protein
MPCPVLNNCFPRTFHLIGRNPLSPRPRSRSPLYNRRDDRGHTPPRYQEYPSDSRISHDRGRAESPPSRSRGCRQANSTRCPGRLTPTAPPRRSDTRDPDYSAKRRKTEDRDGNASLVRRGLVGPDTYTPQETSTASTSPRSTGALDDFSRMSGLSHIPFTLVSFAPPTEFPGPRRREPLPSQSLRYKEASSDQSHRRPVSGSNRVMPHPQPTYVVLWPQFVPLMSTISAHHLIDIILLFQESKMSSSPATQTQI